MRPERHNLAADPQDRAPEKHPQSAKGCLSGNDGNRLQPKLIAAFADHHDVPIMGIRHIRHDVSSGDFRPLQSPTPTQRDGMALAFLQPAAPPERPNVEKRRIL